MKRLIINYEDDLDIQAVLNAIQQTVELGRISRNGKSFCFMTTFQLLEGVLVVVADVTDTGSDTFLVEKDQNEEYVC